MRPISTASCKEAVPGNIVAASTADGQAAFSPAELVSCLRLGSCDSKLDACDAEGDRPDEEEEDAITYPEGGARAYLAVAGATLAMTMSFGLSNSFGVMQSYLKTHQLSDVSPSAISLIGTVHLAIVFSCSLLSGILFDMGFYRYQLAGGSILWIFGIFMVSISTEYYQFFLSWGLCLGIALALMFTPSLSVCASYFLVRRSLMLGIASTGTALGGILHSILLENLFPELGFGGAIRAMGYMMLGSLAIANLITRPRAIPTRRVPVSILPNLKKISREPLAHCVGWGIFGINIATFIVLFYVVQFVKTKSNVGPNGALAQYSLAIINAVAIASRIVSGLVADRIGIFNTILPAAALLSASTFLLLGATTTPGLVAFLVLFGVAQGNVISIAPGVFFSLAEHPSELGVRGGFGFLFTAIAALIGSPIAGALLTAANGNYLAPCAFGGCACLLGTALLTYARWGVLQKRQQRARAGGEDGKECATVTGLPPRWKV